MSRLRFYTQEEKNELQKFVDAPKFSHNKLELEKFCKKYKRNYASVRVYIRNTRKKYTETPTTTTSMTKTPTLKRNEFVIPVTKWELQTSEQGDVMLILKF